jgi:hypothetical protein
MVSDRQPLHIWSRFRTVAVIVVVIAVMAIYALYIVTQNSRAPELRLIPSVTIHGEGFLFEISQPTPWDDFTIVLQDQSGAMVSWAPMSFMLNKGLTSNYTDGPKTLGSLTLSCNITDFAGNGRVDELDIFQLEPGTGQEFSSRTIYTVVMLYGPTSAELYRISFVGTAS